MLNGKSISEIFEIIVTPQITNLKRLKSKIMEQRDFKVLLDSFVIYNYKGLELDTTDIPYLLNNQVIYLCFDGEKFTNKNYLNHLEFIKELKPTRSGVVLLANNLLEKGQSLLVKRIQLQELSNDDIFNIMKETRVIEGIKHSHIVNMINSFIYDDKLYIEMYFYGGGDLNSYLEETKAISEKEAKIFMKQIFDGVRYYHRKGVVHRNLSAKNILFSNEDRDNIVVRKNFILIFIDNKL